MSDSTDQIVWVFVGGAAVAIFIALAAIAANRDLPARTLRRDSCARICSDAGAHSSDPSLCVCKNGRTFPGKAPEFYEVKR